MSKLDLPACPICLAPSPLVRRTRELDARTFTWYECPHCASVLLAAGDRWAYQKIGIAGKEALLKRPLTEGELRAMLPAPRPAGTSTGDPGQDPRQDRPTAEPAAPVIPPRAAVIPDLPAAPPVSRAREHEQAALPGTPQAPARDAGPATLPPAGGRRSGWWVPRVLGIILLVAVVAAAAVGAILVLGGQAKPAPAPAATAGAVASTVTTTPPTSPPTAVPPTPTPTPGPTPTWVPTFTPAADIGGTSVVRLWTVDPETVAEEVSAIRGLKTLGPIKRTEVTRRALPAYLEPLFEAAHPPTALAADTQVLSAFDLMGPDAGLRSHLWDLYSTQAIGLYDPVEDNLLFVTDLSDAGFDLFAQVVLVHDYGLALLDQHFDLAAFLDRSQHNADEILARRALVEGDATTMMVEYLQNPAIAEEEIWDMTTRDLRGDREVLAETPPYLLGVAQFPHLAGSALVDTLLQDGWEAVNAAYADPPQSTEQVLHIDRYLGTRDEPQVVTLPSLTSTLGVGWSRVAGDTMGELRTRLFLEQRLDTAEAEKAAGGWDGDRYALYARDGGSDGSVVLVWSIVWDSKEECAEFMSAYRQYANDRYGVSPATGDDGTLWWEPEGEAAVALTASDRSIIVLAPAIETARAVLAAVRQ